MSTGKNVDFTKSVCDNDFTSSFSVGPRVKSMVDLHDGNLKFIVDDFSWSGYVMPVTIQHMYTYACGIMHYGTNDSYVADYSSMKLGYGWRMNNMLSVVSGTITENNSAEAVFFFTDADGITYTLYLDNENVYKDRVDANISYDSTANEVCVGNLHYQFNSGRLIAVYNELMKDDLCNEFAAIRYVYDKNNRLSIISDGSGREFSFNYDNDGRLSCIVAPDNSAVCYSYNETNNDLLERITYPNGEYLFFKYDMSYHVKSISLLKDSSELLKVYDCNYKLSYDYLGNMVKEVREYGDNTLGRRVHYNYLENNVTKITAIDYDDCGVEDNIIETTYLFDCSGKLIDSYSNHYGYMQSNGSEDNFSYPVEGATYNYDRVPTNLLMGHGFEDTTTNDGKVKDLHYWSYPTENDSCRVEILADDVNVLHGNGYLKITAEDNTLSEGYSIMQAQLLPAGEYTFSAYVKAMGINDADSSIQLSIRTNDGRGEETVKLTDTDNGYIRLFASVISDKYQSITCKISVFGNGIFCVDSAQLEQGSAPTAYNAIENGNFVHREADWDRVNDNDENHKNEIVDLAVTGTEIELDEIGDVMKVEMNNSDSYMPYQRIHVKSYKNSRTTFTLSGFAKLKTATATPNENLRFRLRASINYFDAEKFEEAWRFEDHVAEFSQETNEWQYASITFTKEQFRTVNYIDVICDYFDPNCDPDTTEEYAYFDAVSLTIDETEYNLTESDFGMYNSHDDDKNTSVIKEDSIANFEEIKGRFNLPISNTVYSEKTLGTIYSIDHPNDDFTGYDDKVDARGNITTYTTDTATSRVTKVVDRVGAVTQYSYDREGNVVCVCEYEEKADGTISSSSTAYTYDAFNDVTSATRSDSMKYYYSYNAFHNIEEIGIDGKNEPLVKYGYKNASGTLKTITYANGDSAEIKYDRFGRPVHISWTDADGNPAQEIKYTYDGSGNPVSILDITNKTEYNYIYESGHLVCEMQSEGVTINANGFKTAGTLTRKIVYRYSVDGRIFEKTICDANGTITDKYTYSENGEKTVTLSSDARIRSRSDALGRQMFDEISTGVCAFSRKFEYHSGSIPQEYKDEGKIISSPTTKLVKRISYSNGGELRYDYDNEDRIVQVVENGIHINGGATASTASSIYAYDGFGRIVSEKICKTDGSEETVNVEYDTAGNITAKGGKTYTYKHQLDNNEKWRDLLVSYDGEDITYDKAGNPLVYRGKTFTWTCGRRVKSVTMPDTEGNDVTTTFSYDAFGHLISKSNDAGETRYIYSGNRLLRILNVTATDTIETMHFFYDENDSVIGLYYNNKAYYYRKNLQGDIIGIVNEEGKQVVRYQYDAWGKPIGTQYTISPLDDMLGFQRAMKVANANPFYYRGYFYDKSLELYHLYSRYYDPETGRFINADDAVFVLLGDGTDSFNLFAYCENNPINHCDPLGYSSVLAALGISAAALVKAVLEFAILLIAVCIGIIRVYYLLKQIINFITKAIEAVQEVVETIKAKVEEYNKKNENPSGYCVYVLMRNTSDILTIFYVGRTKNFEKRMRQHKVDKGQFIGVPVAACKDLQQSKLVEQAVLSACILSKFFQMDVERIGTGSNKIRGMAKDKLEYWKNNASNNEIEELYSLLTCTAESDLLLMMEY